MKQIIKTIYDKIIYQGEHDTLKNAVEYCVKNRISLNHASLDYASLNGASLDHASLDHASLNHASLNQASLNGAKYSILNLLKINFSELSDELTLELMRWDVLSCGITKMNEWSKGGKCPFSDSKLREFYFKEKRDIWESGQPNMNYVQLWGALAEERGIKI